MKKNVQAALEENDTLKAYFTNFTIQSIKEILLDLKLTINKINDRNFIGYVDPTKKGKKASLLEVIKFFENLLAIKENNEGDAAEIKYFFNELQIKALEYSKEDKNFARLFSKRYKQENHKINDFIIPHKKSIKKQERLEYENKIAQLEVEKFELEKKGTQAFKEKKIIEIEAEKTEKKLNRKIRMLENRNTLIENKIEKLEAILKLSNKKYNNAEKRNDRLNHPTIPTQEQLTATKNFDMPNVNKNSSSFFYKILGLQVFEIEENYFSAGKNQSNYI